MLKTSKIENYLGFETISGSELALKMFNHVKANDIPFEFAEVSLIKKDNFGYIVVAGPKEIHVKHIIIATGRKPLKLNLKNENVIKGISYCAVCDGSFYKDKVVGVVGGGNSAFTNALYLADLCHQVYLFVRSSIKADRRISE